MTTCLYRLKTLSIKEPWASLIMFHGKDVENRSWSTGHRGPLLIHASRSVDLEPDRTSKHNCYQNDWENLRYSLAALGIVNLPENIARLNINPGHILGTVNLTGCIKNSCSIWADRGQYHWLLSNPVPFSASYPTRGQLGIFDTVLPITIETLKQERALAPYKA